MNFSIYLLQKLLKSRIIMILVLCSLMVRQNISAIFFQSRLSY